jgi:DNA polymerase-3 subunit gamma/tau
MPDGPTDFSPDDPVPAVAPQGMGYDGFEPGDEPVDGPAPEVLPPVTVEDQAISLIRQTLGAQTIKGIGG